MFDFLSLWVSTGIQLWQRHESKKENEKLIKGMQATALEGEAYRADVYDTLKTGGIVLGIAAVATFTFRKVF